MQYGQPVAVYYGTDDEYRAHWLAYTVDGARSYVTPTSFLFHDVTLGAHLVSTGSITALSPVKR